MFKNNNNNNINMNNNNNNNEIYIIEDDNEEINSILNWGEKDDNEFMDVTCADFMKSNAIFIFLGMR